MYRNNDTNARTNRIEHLTGAVDGELANFPVNLVANVFRPEGERKIPLGSLDGNQRYDLGIAWDHRKYFRRNIGKDEIFMQILKMESKKKDFYTYVAIRKVEEN